MRSARAQTATKTETRTRVPARARTAASHPQVSTASSVASTTSVSVEPGRRHRAASAWPREARRAVAVTKRPHILIVEDDARAASVIRNTLELEGDPEWSIQVAGDGLAALDLADATPPQVVLLDLGLPGVDGAEVFRRLRERPATRATRVLFLTAATSLDLHQRGVDAGVMLRKPFEVRQLVGIVRSLLA